MFKRSDELDAILSGALAATGGRPCWSGCTLPLEDGQLHICDVTALTTSALHGDVVEVRGGEAVGTGSGAVIYVMQRDPRGKATQHIAWRPEQARAVAEALLALVDQADVEDVNR